MYAIVTTGGKQYKVCENDVQNQQDKAEYEQRGHAEIDFLFALFYGLVRLFICHESASLQNYERLVGMGQVDAAVLGEVESILDPHAEAAGDVYARLCADDCADGHHGLA